MRLCARCSDNMGVLDFDGFVAEKLAIKPITKKRLSELGKPQYALTQFDIETLRGMGYDEDDIEVFKQVLADYGLEMYDDKGNTYTAEEVLVKLGQTAFLRGMAMGVRHHRITHLDITFDTEGWQGEK